MASKKQDLAWYQTTVFRTACLAILIVLGGYVGSLYSIRQALQGFSQMTYDEELAQALTSYLDVLKELDSAQRQTLLLQLQALPRTKAWDELDPNALRSYLVQAGIATLIPIEHVELEKLAKLPPPPDVAWLSRTELRLGRYLVRMPASEVRHRFDSIQQLKQRYELIQATWDQEIAPSLLLTHLLILLGTFACVGAVLLLLVGRYIRDADQVLSGLQRWSESEPEFRLSTALSGELAVIATQFNTMADEVEMNRRRSLYLEKIASWQTMARKLAHEIKNPLTPIQMMVSQLQRSYRGDDPAFQSLLEEATTIVHEEVRSLRRMVDYFSQFARLPDPKWEAGNLLLMCHQVVELQAASYPQHHIVLETELDSAPLMMDSQLLKQVLMNLMKNAAEASADRQAHIVLQLSRQGSRYYQLDVRDDGPGIAAEDMPRVFEAYFTTKHTGPNPGMGLGLAICKKIVMDHQGELTLQSRPGETLFRILLPQHPTHASPIAANR